MSIPSRPHLLNELCVGLCDFPFHPQRVVSVDFSLIFIFEKVVGQRRGIAQALKENTIGAHTPSEKHQRQKTNHVLKDEGQRQRNELSAQQSL